MNGMTILETLNLLHSYEIDCNQDAVERWITEGYLKATKRYESYTVNELDVLDFLVNLSLVGTAYEKGIDDKTKINRLLKEIEALKQEVDKLRKEKTLIEFDLGISPFN